MKHPTDKTYNGEITFEFFLLQDIPVLEVIGNEDNKRTKYPYTAQDEDVTQHTPADRKQVGLCFRSGSNFLVSLKASNGSV